MDFSGTCREEDACVDAMLFSTYQIFPRMLNAAVQLDLFGIIAKEDTYVSASWIASKLAAQNPEAPSMLDRMLRFFASHSLLSSSVRRLEDGRAERVYGLTPASKFYIGGRKDEGSLSPFITLAHQPAGMDVWLHLKDGILEGGDLFGREHGMSIFEYMNKVPEFNTIFHEAMAGISAINTNAILEVYEGFEGITSLVDVGGGTGKTLKMIISKYPSIKGINYDLPHVVQSAPQYQEIQHVGGNMLASIPNGEAIMIKDTCHNWKDEKVVILLRNIFEALQIGGKLIIMNAIMSEEVDTTKISQYVSRLDAMMLALPAGKERTAQEFKALTEAAGFTNFRVACIAHGIWAVMESFK